MLVKSSGTPFTLTRWKINLFKIGYNSIIKTHNPFLRAIKIILLYCFWVAYNATFNDDTNRKNKPWTAAAKFNTIQSLVTDIIKKNPVSMPIATSYIKRKTFQII